MTAGFIGLGNMGGPMAANLAARFPVLAYDRAGTKERAPNGAAIASSTAEVAAGASTIFLSLPDGAAVASVLDEIIAALQRTVTTVVDLSTIGPAAARENAARLAGEAGIAYLDAPVSGGTTGARTRAIAMMCAGDREAFERNRDLLDAISARVFYVGGEAGQGQALKVLNNFLSATAMVATSEAIAFGTRMGLDMAVMLEVLNAATGQNSATSDKFPRRILTGTYDAGFTNTLLAKDVGLYLEAARETGVPSDVGELITSTWRSFRDDVPGADFTRIYPWLTGEDS